MFQREEVEKILKQAESIDPEYVRFGASRHHYKLNPPVSKAFVREMEEKYHFRLPEDYVQFITEVGDGGAGPDYGIEPFGNFLRKGKDPYAEKFQEEYRCSLAKEFKVRPMRSEEAEEYAFTREAYERTPENFFVDEKVYDDSAECIMEGYFVLGTHGCQWDFGLITAGERRGQVFDTDNEMGYCFLAESFSEFYQNWLDDILDVERFQEELERWRRIQNRVNR